VYGFDIKKNFKVFKREEGEFATSEDGFLIPKIANIFN